MKTLGAAGVGRPDPWPLYGMAIGADVSSNGLLYALVPAPEVRTPWTRGLIIGALTGLSALVLPPLLKLGTMPGRRTPQTQLMTLGWYTLGGLAAAAVDRARR